MSDTNNKIRISQECGIVIENGKIISFDYDLFSEAITRDFDRRKELEAENKRLRDQLSEQK